MILLLPPSAQTNNQPFARVHPDPKPGIARHPSVPLFPRPLHPLPIVRDQIFPLRHRRWPNHIPQRHRHFPNAAYKLHHGARERGQDGGGVAALPVHGETEQQRGAGVHDIQRVQHHVGAEEARAQWSPVELRALVGARGDGAADCEGRRVEPGG